MPAVTNDLQIIHRKAAARAEERLAAAERIMEEGQWRRFDDEKRVIERLKQRGYGEFAAVLAKKNRPLALNHGTRSGRVGHGSLFLVQTAKGRPPPSMSTSFLIDGEVVRRTVARVVTGTNKMPIGSGFLVGPGLFMTNHHVLRTQDEALIASAQFDYVTASGGETPQIHRFDPGKLFCTNPDLDYTIVGVNDLSSAERTLADRGWNRLIKESGKAITNERVNIIQHPEGSRQKVALRQNQIVTTYDSFIYYTTNTWGGSSGAPVLNDEWKVVALHKGTVERDGAVNYGVRISEIAKDLQSAKISGSEPSVEGCFAEVPADVLRKARIVIFGWQEMFDTDDPPEPPDNARSRFARDMAAWDELSRTR